jgi:hypothetical protein
VPLTTTCTIHRIVLAFFSIVINKSAFPKIMRFTTTCTITNIVHRNVLAFFSIIIDKSAVPIYMFFTKMHRRRMLFLIGAPAFLFLVNKATLIRKIPLPGGSVQNNGLVAIFIFLEKFYDATKSSFHIAQCCTVQ